MFGGAESLPRRWLRDFVAALEGGPGAEPLVGPWAALRPGAPLCPLGRLGALVHLEGIEGFQESCWP